MFRSIKNLIPAVAGILAGGATFKILKDAKADEKTIILGTAVAGGSISTLAEIGINILDKPEVNLEIIMQEDEADDSDDDFESDGCLSGDESEQDSEEIPPEETSHLGQEPLLDIDEVQNFVRDVTEDGIEYIFGHVHIMMNEKLDTDARQVRLIPCVGAIYSPSGIWSQIPEDALDEYCEELEKWVNQKIPFEEFIPQQEPEEEHVMSEEEAAEAFAAEFIKAAEQGDEAVDEFLDNLGRQLTADQFDIPDPKKKRNNRRKNQKKSGNRMNRNDHRYI